MISSALDARPIVIAVAGPNGAGKTTFFHAHLESAGLLVLSADVIARETIRALGAYTVDQSTQRQAKAIPLEVSAHHVHLA